MAALVLITCLSFLLMTGALWKTKGQAYGATKSNRVERTIFFFFSLTNELATKHNIRLMVKSSVYSLL